jgi:hypothetical protein
MLLDNPINEREAEVLAIIAKETNDDPYAEISLADLEPEDLDMLDEETLEELIQVYLDQSPVDFVRLGWLIRRLTQVGAPGALRILAENMPALSPVLGPIARYMISSIPNYRGDVLALGEEIVDALDMPVVGNSPYLQTVLIDVVSVLPELNHVDTLTARYGLGQPAVRRSILLAAGAAGRIDWLRERKDEFRSEMDPWSRRAFIKAMAAFSEDERRFWLEGVRESLNGVERIVAKHFLSNTKVGEIRLRNA